MFCKCFAAYIVNCDRLAGSNNRFDQSAVGKDYYKILGVPKDADDATLKKVGAWALHYSFFGRCLASI